MGDRPTGIPKKRNRIPLSCESCRIRKLKCDRQKPCLNCLSRDLACVFATGNMPRARGARPTATTPQDEDLKLKLQRLEQLVSVMAENAGVSDGGISQQDTPPRSEGLNSPTGSPDFEARPGHLIEAQRGQHYVGPSSWETILHDIADIREHLDELPYVLEDQSPLSTHRNPALLGGVSVDITYQELREGLPSRALSDRLVTRFFESYDPAVPSRQVLHRPSFMKQYENFWLTMHNGFCPYFIGICYGVYCLALQSYFRQDEEPADLEGRTRELAELYRKRSAQCCLKSDITAPTRRAVEALLLCAACEYIRHGDGFIGQWFLLGILIRKALHMGLHREPDEFNSLSPFEKELRRRLWAHIWQVDMLYSFQLGLPNSIHVFKSDVASPSNLFEEEITEDMEELPPSRPENVQTPIGFTIAKLNLSRALGDIVEHLNVRRGHSFEEISELNKRLREARSRIPKYLQVQPSEWPLEAPRSLRLQRLQLQSFYNKAACMLNRRFIAMSEHKGPICMEPRAVCVESALDMLSIQDKLETEQCKWWLVHMTKHDFLLAATVLYLVLFTKRKERRHGFNPLSGADPEALDEEDVRINEALDRSRAIWGRLADGEPSEARQACHMFDSMRRQLQSMDNETKSLQPPMTPATVDSSLNDLKLVDMGYTETVAPPNFDGFAVENTQFTEFDWGQWESAMQVPGVDGMDGLWPSEIDLTA